MNKIISTFVQAAKVKAKFAAIVVHVFILSTMLAILPAATASASGSLAVSGTVTDPSGNGVANVTVIADAPGTTTVDFGPTTTASDGGYTLYVDAGSYDFHFDPPIGSSLNSMNDSYVTISENQTLNMQLNATISGYHNISGTITDQNGNVVNAYSPNSYSTNAVWLAYMWLSSGGSSYGGNFNSDTGHFSFSVPASTYDTFQINLPGYILNTQDPILSGLATRDIIQNFKITFVGVTATAKDANGNTLSGVSVTARLSSSDLTPPFVGGSSIGGHNNVQYPTYTGTTDSNGSYAFIAPAGIIIPGNPGGPYGSAYGLCATVSSNQVCTTSDLTVTQPVSVTLQQDPTPVAPTNLLVTSPANNPTLTWTSSSGTVWYTIYRDGVNSGATPGTTTFTDTYAQEGTHTYYVAASNSGGESVASNTITVVVDKTAPIASNVVLSPTHIKSGGTMTITANASDALSVATGEFFIDTDPGIGNGTPMVYANGKLSAQTTVSGLTRGSHIVYIRAKDNAGNWSSLAGGSFRFNP